MALLLLLFLATLATLILCPSEAWAWGPGVHLAICNQLLHTPRILGPELAALLAAHPQAFLYGALSADIFVGKGCRAKPGHSHNWETALDLLKSVASPEQHAYALGYATHLAADVLAHNFYVPTMLGTTPGSGKLSHVLLELQADRQVRWSGGQAKGLFRLPDMEAQDALLRRATQQANKWPFLLKKQIYKGSVRISSRKELHKTLHRLQRMLPAVLPEMQSFSSIPEDGRVTAIVWRNQQYLQQMLDLSLVLAREAVLQPQVCLARNFDPVGSENLAAVRRLRRDKQQRIVPPGELFPLPPQLQRFALDLQNLKEPDEEAGVSVPDDMCSLRGVDIRTPPHVQD